MTLPDVIVEIDFAGAVGTGEPADGWFHLDDPTTGVLDGTAVLGPDNTWVDVTAWVLGFTSSRGSTRMDGPLVRYDPGTATVTLDNSDRRFDPTNLAGPYVTAGITQVTPRRPLRIRATWEGITYPIFRGHIDEWPITYEGPQWSQVTVPATDVTKALSNINRETLGTLVGVGELSGARVNRVLNSVEWVASDRDLDAGQTTVQGTTLEGDPWAEMLLDADTEIGDLYVDAAGRVVFRDRHAPMRRPERLTSQLVLSDQADEMSYDPNDLSLVYSDDQVRNDIRITRVGGSPRTASDAASMQQYLRQTFERTDLLMQTDTEAGDYATFLLGQVKDPELRFDSVTLNPLTDNSLFPHVLGRDFGDRVTVVRHPPGGGDPIVRDVFVLGVAHSSTPGSWLTGWSFQSATVWSYLVLDSPTDGVLDSARLAY